ncbi:MAG: sn-glycerol-3-phosphate ABC transporter ATP-binding protein UgpC [Bosea sp.]|uniref:ABC transporter ATP-binding protein n=1 Tax=unclassified Bosea (in: a-proteobacteria) TaxID=2653178 RepID=UPI00095D9F1F|nr:MULTISPECIES: sn-glycerol-3-phosphate ABC transporter ATP-binding protein UgpC [unclassified Bosea (in: a-proteobacteria)]MBN9443207.1 sn-glycerol-3-phosphate ABC transporter ATP-binding protein UgpC [Bosea sp. (in: a-proteobacteria)]MBN9458059.1 sn-glycerol-3-phosphate ABC transporter ATP-binding protein UgpC [Bosea sp. (in: a-proteobacteria)]OJV10569.1 MAG: sugar ABC transporter ATP-binding protein [Bosea sp. 67-29]
MARIELERIVKRYGSLTTVHGIDLTIDDGEFVVLVGPSGCGKSTTLRMIAGLEPISGGTLRIGGEVVNDREPKYRNIAMVFQNYAIYPHLTVAQNIGFGLYTSRLSKAAKQERIRETARALSLEPYLERRPAALSGGQRQRVAIGRAMVRDPVAFLFDEPLSNLDAQLRGQMRLEIKQLHQRLGSTIVFVTHDQVEAMSLADRIVVMRDGRILQVGSPMELYNRPGDVFTARFIGTPEMNMIDAVISGGRIDAGANAASLRLPDDAELAHRVGQGREIILGIRPQALNLLAAGRSDYPITIEGRVRVAEPHGPETFVLLDLPQGSVVARAPSTVPFRAGEAVAFGADIASLLMFDKQTEALLG